MKFKVLIDDINLLVISKPKGIEYHGEEGVVQIVRREFPDIIGVHRLDRETSGILIFARNKETAKKLGELFEQKKIQKEYLALSRGKPKKKQGLIGWDLEKSRNGSYNLSRAKKTPSKTKFFSYYMEEFDLRLFHLFPLTGKTHQLRVVMKSLATPIIGDNRYGGEKGDRMYLHAFKTCFDLGENKYVIIDYPEDGELFVKVKREMIDLLG